MSWPVERTREVYANRWITVREDQVRRPDGSDGLYGVVTVRSPAVFVVALTEADEVLLVTIDRHTVGASVEVPAGGTDGEDPLVAARRELAEETGMAARTWRRLGTMTALNGICEAEETVFLATDLEPAPGHDAATLVEEGITAVRRVPLRDVLAMVAAGEITDGETQAALLHALIALGRVH
ncbi:NUDIX hydrolase [Humibacillus sp. DSM 29435]|uniref:NUDIX domain-containing protein n=1 Tax=Humibacillus sp. DSM 29435 TaxID=1869167 RepID=UPI000871C58A|nr:NUDIX hydrolase [Humibacillus sp. DSM 29435]OFE15901.1 NUDIX hydrolase [Humibacillus sp. DSM 29435]